MNPTADGPERTVPAADGFGGVRAFADLKRLVDFGLRPAASKNLEQARRWIVEQLRGEHMSVDSDDHDVPFKFTGRIDKVTIDLKRMEAATAQENEKLQRERVLAKHNRIDTGRRALPEQIQSTVEKT